MSTLVIHAPRTRVAQEGKQSFEATLESGVGDEYAIYSTLRRLLNAGDLVVLLDKDRELRAEGTLLSLNPRSVTANGVQRYDVHVKDLKWVSYKPERLNRCGVSVM